MIMEGKSYMQKSIAIMTAAILCAVLCACENTEAPQDSGNYIYGQISSISGNDVTLMLAEYTEPDSDDDSAETAESMADGARKPQDGSGRGDFDRENMPEGFDPENMPNRGNGTKIGNYTLTGET